MGRLLLLLQLALIAALLFTGAAPESGGSGSTAVARFAAENGIPASFVERGGTRFLLVPPGAFPWRAPSGEVHAVTLRLPYYIQAEPAAPGTTWYEAAALGTAMTTANADHVYRLPTEAEWALADERYPVEPAAVSGVWCADWFGPHPEQDLSDPVGPRAGTRRLVRARGRTRRGVAPHQSEPRLGVRLVAELGWRGDRAVTIRTVLRDLDGKVVEAKAGYRIRLIRILDRLADRQAGRQEEWAELEGTSPFSVRMFPGRYYLVAVDDDALGTPREGPELKALVDSGPHTFEVDVPGPRLPPSDER